MHIEAEQLSSSDVYHLITQAVIPRPIAWVLTDSGLDNYNLAPFSYFTPVASDPPLLMISVGKKPNGDLKDTARNILAQKHLVIHIASEPLAEQMTATAATLEHGQSEVVLNHIELAEFSGFPLPRVKACALAFGCELYHCQTIGNTPQTLIFAQVKAIYVDSTVMDERASRLTIDALKLNPLSRLGGGEYAVLERTFSIARPQ